MAMELPAAVTLEQTPQLLAALDTALARAAGGARFEIDAAALREFDTSAIALLLHARRGARARDLAFEVRNPPSQLRELAVLYGVEDLLALQASAA